MQRRSRARARQLSTTISAILIAASCDLGPAEPANREYTVTAVGDIAACDNSNQALTAALVDSVGGPVLALGDLAYENGSTADFAACYQPTWGRHRARTRPVPGNHEYSTPGASGYYEYFGAIAGDPARGYYAFEVGPWLMLALNSNIPISAGSPQELWVRQQVAATPRTCTLAYWHHPRFSSSVRGNDAAFRDIWNTLAELGVDVILTGHDHIYERFARLNAAGALDDAGGVASFIVGTGGRSLHALGAVQTGSQVRRNTEYGVLRLTLRSGGYSWAFVAVGGDFKDTGTALCR